MVSKWEREAVQWLKTDTIKNYIWAHESLGQPIPGCISVEALRTELVRRGEAPRGYHDT